MRMSTLVGRRYKERPAEATLEGHALLLRGAYIRQVANGVYSLLPPALRIIRKIENIIREEMERIGGQEVLMPLVLPRELWDESGRYTSVGSELARFDDRTGHNMLLAMTHEEAVVHLVRNETSSYKQYPFMLFQIQTKFRDEPRSRGGLIRVREFTMKDAYSFHTSEADLQKHYEEQTVAYHRIFARAGVPEVVAVQSDTGMMGGKIAHEFMLLADCGEDTIVTCDRCDYLANSEVATGRIAAFAGEALPLEKVHTPKAKTIEEVAKFLKMETRQMAKVVAYKRDAEGRLVIAVIRGDVEVNEAKLSKLLGCAPVMADEDHLRSHGLVPGFLSPVGLTNVRVIADLTVRDSANLVCGGNEADYHCLNFNLLRDAPQAEVADIAHVREGDGCPHCEGSIVLRRGIEVGNIFQLGRKYTESMSMRYLDERGESQIPIMGCYGIGVGRLLSSVMEARHDAFGPLWPVSIAPYQVHLNALKIDNPEVCATADRLYNELQALGLEVVYDDRGERPGVQFSEADLLGVPLRLIVSERNTANGEVEWKIRGEKESTTVPLAEAATRARQWIDEALAAINRRADERSAG